MAQNGSVAFQSPLRVLIPSDGRQGFDRCGGDHTQTFCLRSKPFGTVSSSAPNLPPSPLILMKPYEHVAKQEAKAEKTPKPPFHRGWWW